MKTLLGIVLLCVVTALPAAAQFKSQADQPSASESLIKPMSGINSFLGLLNPDNFSMRQSLAYNFISAGGSSLSVASYTNSMMYKIADPLNVRFDVTLQGTPSGAGQYQNALNGLFLSRAELNYRPWQNFFVRLEYNHLPSSYFNSFNDPWYYPSLFSADPSVR